MRKIKPSEGWRMYNIGWLWPEGMQPIYVETIFQDNSGEGNMGIMITYSDRSQRIMHFREYMYYYEKYLFPVGGKKNMGEE